VASLVISLAHSDDGTGVDVFAKNIEPELQLDSLLIVEWAVLTQLWILR